MTTTNASAHFDHTMNGVVIEHVVVTDKDVAREAQRWTTGERGPVVDDVAVLAGANLTAFVAEAVKIGAHALSAAGQVRETNALDRMLKEVGDRTSQASTEAAKLAERAARDAASTVTKATDAAKKALVEVDARTRSELIDAVKSAKIDLSAEVRRIFGGDSPEFVERLQPLLDQFGTRLDARVAASTTELIKKATSQFDPAVPTSPMAKHQAMVADYQEKLIKQLTANHQELAKKVEEVVTALKIEDAKATIASVTPIKGDSYADQVHRLMLGIASGLGDEYVDTSALTGKLPRSKKGDGVLTIGGAATRVVVEMTDSARVGWIEYLDEAERNRDAMASLGLVRSAIQNGGQTVRVLGPRQIVMAFDPDHDDTDILRTVVLLLRTASLTTAARSGAHEIATAEEKVGTAIDALSKIDDMKKLAASIGNSAEKIDRQCSSVTATVRRLLAEALDALAGVEHEEAHEAREGAA